MFFLLNILRLLVLVIPFICEIIIFVYSAFVKKVQAKLKFIFTTLIIDFSFRISHLFFTVDRYNVSVRMYYVEDYDNYEYLWFSGCLLAASIILSLVLILSLIAVFMGFNKKLAGNLVAAHLICVISASIILVSVSLKNSYCNLIFSYCLSSLLNASGLMIYKKKYKKAAVLSGQTPETAEKSAYFPKHNNPVTDFSVKTKEPEQEGIPGISLLSDEEINDIKRLLINKIITLEEYGVMIELKVLEKRFLNNEISENEYISKVNELNNS